MSKHKKHTNLVRRNNDNFAANEISILGTNCNTISNLVSKISQKLPNYKIAYFDASHAKDVKKNRLNGMTYDQILTYLKDTKKEDRLEKLKLLLKFRNISFDADLFTWHNEDIN